MDQAIQFLAQQLGISVDTAEGSLVVLALMLVLYLLKAMGNLVGLLKSFNERDEKRSELEEKQTKLEQTLAELAMRSLNSYDASIKTVEENNKAIQQVVEVLKGMEGAFPAFVGEMKYVTEGLKLLTEKTESAQPVLNEIKDNLIKTSETPVVIKDIEGNVMLKFTAKPDEDGVLVVQFSSLVKMGN